MLLSRSPCEKWDQDILTPILFNPNTVQPQYCSTQYCSTPDHNEDCFTPCQNKDVSTYYQNEDFTTPSVSKSVHLGKSNFSKQTTS